MEKRTITIITVGLILTIGVGISLYYMTFGTNSPQSNVLPSGEAPKWQLKLTGNVNVEKILTLKELSQLSLTNVTTIIDGENATYVGVPLYDLCSQSDLQWDVGEIDIIGSGGKKASLNIFEAYNSSAYPYFYNSNVITLAFVKNGQWMTSDTGGPLKLIAPYFDFQYQVEGVSELHFNQWEISITGDVATPITITSQNLSSLPSQTIYAEFAPSEKRTSNWTGIPILDVLEIAGSSERAEKIRLVAIDGYEKKYTLQQVQDGLMLIGYAENDQPLPIKDGGPFRLFAPTEQYKWAQYWVKYITEIIVD